MQRFPHLVVSLRVPVSREEQPVRLVYQLGYLSQYLFGRSPLRSLVADFTRVRAARRQTAQQRSHTVEGDGVVLHQLPQIQAIMRLKVRFYRPEVLGQLYSEADDSPDSILASGSSSGFASA